MGCDIHFFTEKHTGTKWETADTWKEEKYADEPAGIWAKSHYYSGRSYDLFAILANVRNGYGFAGCPTGEGFVPMAEPRGIPDDACAEYLRHAKEYGEDGHSHSYFTLRELLDFNWTQTTTKTGWMSFEQWEDWSRWGRSHGEYPKGWCGGISGRDVIHIEAGDMDALCKQYRDLPREDKAAFAKLQEHKYAKGQWETAYYTAAGSFWSETIPRLLHLAHGTTGVDGVRVCFFFDN